MVRFIVMEVVGRKENKKSKESIVNSFIYTRNILMYTWLTEQISK